MSLKVLRLAFLLKFRSLQLRTYLFGRIKIWFNFPQPLKSVKCLNVKLNATMSVATLSSHHYWSYTTVITAETWKTAPHHIFYNYNCDICNSSFFYQVFYYYYYVCRAATARLQLFNLSTLICSKYLHIIHLTRKTTTIETGSRKNNLIRFVVSGVPCQVKLWLIVRTGWPILCAVVCNLFVVRQMNALYMEKVCILIQFVWKKKCTL